MSRPSKLQARPRIAGRDQAVSLDAALFQMAFHNSPAMQSVIRASDGTIVEVNNTFLEKLGRTRQQVIGKTPIELGSWAEPQKLLEYRQQLETHGQVRGYEVRLIANDGSVLTVLLSTHQVQIGNEPYFLSAGVDITARKAAEARLRESEAQLRESEARFATAFNASPILMTISRLADGRFVEVNSAFMKFYGLEPAELIGKDSRELGLWVNDAARGAFFERLQRDSVLRDVECQVRARGGVVCTLLLSAQVMEINRQPHIITFGLDITRNKEAETELQNALFKERELNQLKSDFVSLVSHEFRTPLEVIMSSNDNLQRYHERLPREKREQLLNTIHKSVRRMAGMMEEVLILGRVESGKAEFKPHHFDLPGFCRRVGDEIRTATGRRCPVEVRAHARPHQAFGDENLLRHIFTNLLSNAVKYSPEGKPVIFSISRKEDDAIFQVTDQGCGIPAAEQARVFQAFYRGGNVRQIPGTGLGLIIVRRCVELHRGDIHFESTEGEGTTFVVRLPLFRR